MYTQDYASIFLSVYLIILMIMLGFLLIVTVIGIISRWKIYSKAGFPGWGAIIPIYNSYLLFEISMGNGILFLLTFVPVVNYVMIIIALVKLCAAFGKDTLFIVGMIFFPYIFLPILGFGKSQYIGPQ